jgi:enamine deaminase RidA (YjgF/YER057c/UK114 family)
MRAGRVGPTGFLLAAGWLAAAGTAVPELKAQKKDKEPQTQTLQLPRELPGAVVADPRKLAFHVVPLSNKGLLTQQIKDALKALARETAGETVLRLRAFTAGSGDLRRVRDLVSETFTDRRQPLPALTVVQAGGLPLVGAQLALEAITATRKEVNPHGLAFFSAQAATSEDPLAPVEPLTAKSLAGLRQAVEATGAAPADVLRVTCYFSSMDNLAASRALVEAQYPRAALNYVQTQRGPARALAACEAVARLPRAQDTPVRFITAGSAAVEPPLAAAALVAAHSVALSSAQSSFGYGEDDARLAFNRLNGALASVGSSLAKAAWVSYYSLASGISAHIRKTAPGFYSAQTPAGALLSFEGLSSMDAGFAVDAIAIRE